MTSKTDKKNDLCKNNKTENTGAGVGGAIKIEPSIPVGVGVGGAEPPSKIIKISD